MRLFQNRKVIGVICVIFAALLAFLVIPGINKSKSDTVKIIKLNRDILQGTRISEDMLRETEVGKYGLPEHIVTNKEEVIGKYSNCDIKSDDIIMASKLSDYAANEKLDGIFNDGNKLVTITVSSIAAGVGNHIKPGDVISVLLYKDNTVETFDELRNIEIYSIENDDAKVLKESDEDDTDDNIASTITLIVNEEQAKWLVYAEYSGKLHVVFERRGAME